MAYQSVLVAGCENPVAYSLSLHNYFWREAVTCAGWHQAVEQQEQTWMTGLSYSLGACAMSATVLPGDSSCGPGVWAESIWVREVPDM